MLGGIRRRVNFDFKASVIVMTSIFMGKVYTYMDGGIKLLKTLVVHNTGQEISVGKEWLGHIVGKIKDCEDDHYRQTYEIWDDKGKLLCQFSGGSYMGVYEDAY